MCIIIIIKRLLYYIVNRCALFVLGEFMCLFVYECVCVCVFASDNNRTETRNYVLNDGVRISIYIYIYSVLYT